MKDIVNLIMATIYKMPPKKYQYKDIVAEIDQDVLVASLNISRLRLFLLVEEVLDVFCDQGKVTFDDGFYQTVPEKIPPQFNDGCNGFEK